MKRLLIAVTVLFTLSACAAPRPGDSSTVEQPSGSKTGQQTESPTPLIVELQDGDTYDLEAEIIEHEINGQKFRMFGYNGTIPGPIIKAPQGAEVQINFTNSIDIDQTVHSHGVRLDYRFDGVPDISQEPVEVGETFTYTIKFPDSGTYWYHPHIREDYAQELGLYGNYVVVPEDPDEWNPVNREEYLFLDDIRMDRDDIESFSLERINYALMGRFGNTFLVNGLTNYRRDLNKGEVVRIALTNSANTRTFNLSIPGARVKLVGLDGSAVSQEKFVDSVMVSPSERVVVEVLFEEAGEFTLTHTSPDRVKALATFNVLDESQTSESVSKDYSVAFEQLRQYDITAEIPDFEKHLSREPDKKIRLTVDAAMNMMNMDHDEMSGMPCHRMPDGTMMGDCESDSNDHNDGIEWEDEMPMMNAMSTHQNTLWKIVDEETGAENMEINWNFTRGEPVKISIFNDPDSDHPMQHPIHFHGQRFLVLTVDGEPNETLAWKDTTLVPTGKTMEILLDTSNPGEWMAHCHIAEHLHSGMMFTYSVE